MENVNERLFLEDTIAVADTFCKKFPEIDHLKEEQVSTFAQFVLNKNVFAVLPTGFGKYFLFKFTFACVAD